MDRTPEYMGMTALVTGGSRGIGAEISRRLALGGASVLVIYRADAATADSFVESLPGPGIHRAIQCDVSVESEIYELIETVLAEHKVSILVNNAGRILRPSDWSSVTFDGALNTFAEHVIAPMLLIKAFAPLMSARGYGRIVNIHTTYADKGSSAVLAYTAAKSALATVTHAMAREVAADGVTVNGIAPGNIDTEMTRSAGEETVQWAISTTPAGRLGYVSEVGDAFEYLVANPFITGAVLPLDGGQRLEI